MMNPNQMNPGGPYYPHPVRFRANNNRRAIMWVLGIIAVLFMLLVGLLTLAMIGYRMESGALLTGMLVATLPVPVYLLLLLWLDRYEAEPLWMLALAFLWGATTATFVAIIVNSEGARFVAINYGRAEAVFYGMVISAPIVEESMKAVILFAFFWWKKDEFDGIMDGIIYAGMVALGFAMTENIKYYGDAVMEGAAMRMDHLTPTLILRGAISPFAHPLFTSMTGIGLGWARQSTNKSIRFIMPLIGLVLAICLHGDVELLCYLGAKLRRRNVLRYLLRHHGADLRGSPRLDLLRAAPGGARACATSCSTIYSAGCSRRKTTIACAPSPGGWEPACARCRTAASASGGRGCSIIRRRAN